VPGPWILLPLLLLAGAGAFAGFVGFDAGMRLAIGLPSAFLTALTLVREK
jgi:hypothetical protein